MVPQMNELRQDMLRAGLRRSTPTKNKYGNTMIYYVLSHFPGVSAAAEYRDHIRSNSTVLLVYVREGRPVSNDVAAHALWSALTRRPVRQSIYSVILSTGWRRYILAS
jgi:hypothetical protein